jgi:uncharacterized membrane protein
MTHGFPTLLAVMAAAALFCRLAGYAAMSLLPPSPRLDAALRATPLAVMAAIAALAVAQGSLTDSLALALAVGLTLATGRDVAAALLAVAAAAVLRALSG